MNTARRVIALVAGLTLVPLTAAAAFAAAPPSNDRPGGAVTLSLGSTVKEDTTQATTGTLDQKVNSYCGAPYTNASVWFTYSPSQNGAFIADGTQSNYSTGFMVFRGALTGRNLIACGPDSVGVRYVAGKTYTIMAFSATPQNGGQLVLSLTKAPPAPTISVTLDPTGKAFANGNARISGTYTCTNANDVEMYGNLMQIWRRVKITAYFDTLYLGTVCDGTAQPWTQILRSDNGLFAKGDATADIFADACGAVYCTGARLRDAHVTLEPAGGSPTGLSAASGSVTLSHAASCAAEKAKMLWAMTPACKLPMSAVH